MPLDDYRNLLAGLNGLTQESKLRFGSAVQCRAGCALCCHGLFDIGVLDAALLHHAWMNSPERDAIEAAAEELLAKIAAAAPAWNYPYDLAGIDDEAVDAVLEQIGMVACPVLGAAQQCRLYDDRPFYCRVHGLKLRDTGGQVDIDTSCELNFPQTPAKDLWPGYDFSKHFTDEGALIEELGLNPDSRYLIPAVTTRRFASFLPASSFQKFQR